MNLCFGAFLFGTKLGSMNYSKISPKQHPFLKVLECCGESEQKQAVKELYYYGKLPDPRPRVVAIVGARHSTKYGEEAAYRAAYELAKRGVVVVSGLAYGIDSCAHRGCLDAGGITVAILGTPIDKIYPRCNLDLSRRILERGAILSEYPPRHETRAYDFQIRNRIVSGLADAVLIVEASLNSGTYGTYESALKQGKEVFVAPGDLTRPMSNGTNDMLRQGANPYLDVDDIMLSFGSRAVFERLNGLPRPAMNIFAAVQSGYETAEDIMTALKLDAATVGTALTLLELRGLIECTAGKWSAR